MNAQRPSKRDRRTSSLLRAAGIDAGIESFEVLGIGSAGLGARGNKDEDGTNTRVLLDDGTSVIYREFDPRGMMSDYLAKELAVFRTLEEAGLPTPRLLASTVGSPGVGGDPAAALLSDSGGEPLEEVFRVVRPTRRATLWSTVGATLRRLHDVDISDAPFLAHPRYQRPWTRFVPYFAKSLRYVKKARTNLAPAIDELLALRRPIADYLDAKPRAICFTGGYYPLPGMLLERVGTVWRCASWLSLGYYVSISDPQRDVVSIALAHREWTGDDVPASFFKAYGSRPDPVCELVYEAALQLKRGAAYEVGRTRTEWGPPPHSTATRTLDELPQTVDRLRSLLLGA